MGPRVLEQAYLHRPAAAPPRQPPGGARRRLDGQRGVRAARTPGSRASARSRRRPGPRPSLHRPRRRRPRLPAPPGPARRPRRALPGGPLRRHPRRPGDPPPKKKMNTKKATVVTGGAGRTLRAGAFRPGRVHDQTAVRTEGIAGLVTQFPGVRAKVDARYRGLAKEIPDQAQAPPLKPKKDATPADVAALDEAPPM